MAVKPTDFGLVITDYITADFGMSPGRMYILPQMPDEVLNRWPLGFSVKNAKSSVDAILRICPRWYLESSCNLACGRNPGNVSWRTFCLCPARQTRPFYTHTLIQSEPLLLLPVKDSETYLRTNHTTHHRIRSTWARHLIHPRKRMMPLHLDTGKVFNTLRQFVLGEVQKDPNPIAGPGFRDPVKFSEVVVLEELQIRWTGKCTI